MERAIGRKVIVLLAILVAVSLLIVSPALGQEKTKVETKAYGVMTVMDQIEFDDVEGHTMSVYESKGTGMGDTGGFTFISKGQSDLIKGVGTHHGYQKNIDKDGDVWFGEWEGKVMPIQMPSGKTTLGFEGVWSYTRGTGKWEGVQGGGAYKGIFIGDGVYMNEIVGDYIIKK